MGRTEYADCPSCDKAVAVYNPKHGDGSLRITCWHKRPNDNGGTDWCRAEVDYGVRTIRDTRLPTAWPPVCRPPHTGGRPTPKGPP